MKKYALLLLLVLGMSSAASAYCKVDVCVAPTKCGDPLVAQVKVCCTGQWTVACTKTTVYCNTIYLDAYLKCTSLCGCQCRGPVPVKLLDKTKCGWYVVVVRVWMDYSECCCWPYCMYPPMLSGMGSAFTYVPCCTCGCYPCPCPSNSTCTD
jgi:hypothetical protein